eukprot:PhM_4_TR9751/c3_g1_i1/m.80843/K11858/USP48; ubiquitin carboxyl-terminal hydrolase 48
MYSIPRLRHAVMTMVGGGGSTDATTPAEHLARLMFRMQFSGQPSHSPAAFLGALAIPFDEQQDAHEFVRLLLSYLESGSDVLKRTTKELFTGIVKHNRRCGTCGNVGVRCEEVSDLTLQVQGIQSLEDSLRTMEAEELLEGDNQYVCNQCNCKRDGSTCTVLARAPRVLVCQLVRFTYDDKTHTRRKVTDKFSFPLRLQTASFPVPHELTCVVLHKGSTPHAGHYITHVRHADDPRKWSEINDRYVSDVTGRYTSAQSGRVDGCSEAYILVYTQPHSVLSSLEPLPPLDKKELEAVERSRRDNVDAWSHYAAMRTQLQHGLDAHNDAREYLKRGAKMAHSLRTDECYALSRHYVKAFSRGGFLMPGQEEAFVSSSDEDDTITPTSEVQHSEEKVGVTVDDDDDGNGKSAKRRRTILVRRGLDGALNASTMMCPHRKLRVPLREDKKVPYKIVSRPMMVAMGFFDPAEIYDDDDNDGSSSSSSGFGDEDNEDAEQTNSTDSKKKSVRYPLQGSKIFCEKCAAEASEIEKLRTEKIEIHNTFKTLAQAQQQQQQTTVEEPRFWVTKGFYDAWRKQSQWTVAEASSMDPGVVTHPLLCPHEMLVINVALNGVMVSSDVWQYMVGPFRAVTSGDESSPREVRDGAPFVLCTVCQSEVEKARAEASDERLTRQLFIARMPSLGPVRLYDNNKRVSTNNTVLAQEFKRHRDRCTKNGCTTIPNVESVFYGVDVEWVAQLHAWLSDKTATVPKPQVRDLVRMQRRHMCPHYGVMYTLEDLQYQSTPSTRGCAAVEPKLALVTPEEWQVLEAEYQKEREAAEEGTPDQLVGLMYSEVNDKRVLHPDTCEECRHERRKTFTKGSVTVVGRLSRPTAAVQQNTRSRNSKQQKQNKKKKSQPVDVSLHVASSATDAFELSSTTTLADLQRRLVTLLLRHHQCLVDWDKLQILGLPETLPTPYDAETTTLRDAGILSGSQVKFDVLKRPTTTDKEDGGGDGDDDDGEEGYVTWLDAEEAVVIPEDSILNVRDRGFDATVLTGGQVPVVTSPSSAWGGGAAAARQWSCPRCTFDNPMSCARCEMCEGPKP